MFRSISGLLRQIMGTASEIPQQMPAQIPPDAWDPIPYGNEQPTAKCLSIVVRHIADLNDHRPRGVFIEPEDDDVTKIHVLVMGPTGTPYEGGFFHFLLKCLPDYPARPPLVRLMTTDCNRVRFNPSFYENGKVCLALLGTDTTGPTWTRHHSIGNVVTAIQSLLSNANPVADGSAFGVIPAMGTWLNSGICYNTVLQHETIRVAVCDAVEGCLRGSSRCPNPLRDEMLKHFSQFYGYYEKVVRERLPLTGSFMNDAFEGGIAAFQYETLLARLQDLRERVGV